MYIPGHMCYPPETTGEKPSDRGVEGGGRAQGEALHTPVKSQGGKKSQV